MTPHDDIPAWAALLAAVFVLLGAGLTATGSFGLLRLPRFYARVHAPTLGTTLGIGFVLMASILYFSVSQQRPVLHEILITVFVTLTTPVTLMVLARAALFRDEAEAIAAEAETAPAGAAQGPDPEHMPPSLGSDPARTRD